MWLCRIGSEFRFSDGELKTGRCNCCPPCTIQESPNPEVCPCPLSGLVLIAACEFSPLTCDPYQPSCGCNGVSRQWWKRYRCCAHWTDPCCCGTCNGNHPCCDGECETHEMWQQRCDMYLEMNLNANRGLHGWWNDGVYFGNCKLRPVNDCCCTGCGDDPACCQGSDQGEIEGVLG